MNKVRENQGLIRLILLIIIGVLVLSYFNFDIKSFIESPITQKNIEYITGWATYIWDEYLASPVLYFWNNIFLTFVWSSFTDGLERLESGDVQFTPPTVPQ